MLLTSNNDRKINDFLYKSFGLSCRGISLILKNFPDYCLLYLFVVVALPIGYAISEPVATYYTRFDVNSCDGVISGTELLMIPANQEFRVEDFIPIRIRGNAKFDGKIDIESAAEHNAVSRLLTSYGLNSITSREQLINGLPGNKVTMSYQGVVKYPLKVLNKGYLGNNNLFSIDLEIQFAPIEFPDKWSALYLKFIMHQVFKDFISLFK